MENKAGKRKFGLSFGIWNIRTLFKPGTARYLVKEIRRYNLEVVDLQEIDKMDDKGTLDLQDMNSSRNLSNSSPRLYSTENVMTEDNLERVLQCTKI